jgi:hypothetical protein
MIAQFRSRKALGLRGALLMLAAALVLGLPAGGMADEHGHPAAPQDPEPKEHVRDKDCCKLAQRIWDATKKKQAAAEKKDKEAEQAADKELEEAKKELEKLPKKKKEAVAKKLGDLMKADLKGMTDVLEFLSKLDKKNLLRALYRLVFRALDRLLEGFAVRRPSPGCYTFYANVAQELLGMNPAEAARWAVDYCLGGK